MNNLEEEVKNLNLKDDKDYLRFKTIRSELRELHKDKFDRGRVPEYNFIIEKERKAFKNYPYQGFECYKSFKEHINKHYLNREFENFEQEQYMWDDLNLQYKRRRIFRENN